MGLEVEAELHQFISRELTWSAHLTADEPLVSSRRIDSLGLVQVLAFIEERFGVNLFTGAEPRDVDSIQALAGTIRRMQRAC